MSIISRFSVTISPKYFETHSPEKTQHLTPAKPYTVIGVDHTGTDWVNISDDIGELYWYKFTEVVVHEIELLKGGTPNE